MEKLNKLLRQIRDRFDEEGWYCVLADKDTFNQNPDLATDFDVGFDYKEVKALSIIDIKNRLVMNCYFYIIDNKTFCLLGDRAHFDKPVIYKIEDINRERLIEDIKKVINYY
jgi:hypothetical protein